eukprot:c20854_g1_i2 orf=3-191(-)
MPLGLNKPPSFPHLDLHCPVGRETFNQLTFIARTAKPLGLLIINGCASSKQNSTNVSTGFYRK